MLDQSPSILLTAKAQYVERRSVSVDEGVVEKLNSKA
jgi:hypothetical protein